MEWKEVKIKDTLSRIIDNRGKTPKELSDFGHPLLEVNCVSKDYKYPLYNAVKKYVGDNIYYTWFRSGHPQKGDILVPTVGTLGAVSLVNRNDCCIAQNIIALRTDNSICHNEFLYYLLNDTTVRKRLLNLDIGGVQPSIKVPHLMNLMISLPPVNLQQKIANILSSLDAKIENNNKINANLEAQAAALFKSWFVDFEPFRDGEFVESELGMIPKGWKVGTLSDLGDIVGGSTPSKSKPEYYTDKGIAWLTPKDLSVSNAKFTSRGEIDITEAGYNSTSAKLMPRGSVLFSSRAPIGYITIAKNDICTNQGFKSVVPKFAGTCYIYYLLKHLTPEIENKSTGSTFKEASGSLMKSLVVIIPPKQNLDEFELKVKSIFDLQEAKENENQRLSSLRDTLLPKLMNGEIVI